MELMDTVVAAELDDNCLVVALKGKCKAKDFKRV